MQGRKQRSWERSRREGERDATCRPLRACVARAWEPGWGRGRREAVAGSGQPPTADSPHAMSPGWQAGDWVRRQVPPCPSWGQGSFGQGRPGPRWGGGGSHRQPGGPSPGWSLERMPAVATGAPQGLPEAMSFPSDSPSRTEDYMWPQQSMPHQCATRASWMDPPNTWGSTDLQEVGRGDREKHRRAEQTGSPDRSALSHGQRLPSPAFYLGTTPSDS